MFTIRINGLDAILNALGEVPDEITADVRDWFEEIKPAVYGEVKGNIPSPDRPEIHRYSKGQLQDTLQVVVRDGEKTNSVQMDVILPVMHASFADVGTTKKGPFTARSWRERGERAHGTESYVLTSIAAVLEREAGRFTVRRR